MTVQKCAFCCKASALWQQFSASTVGAEMRGSLLPWVPAVPSSTPMPGPASPPQLLLLLHKQHTGLSWSFLLMTLTSLVSASGSQSWQWLSDTSCQSQPPINSFLSQVSSNISFVSSSPYVWNKPEEKNCTTRNPTPLESLLKTSPSGDTAPTAAKVGANFILHVTRCIFFPYNPTLFFMHCLLPLNSVCSLGGKHGKL